MYLLVFLLPIDHGCSKTWFADNVQTGSVFLVISGSTDGSISFWDLTESVENFIRSVPAMVLEKSIDSQKRPRTGRGSQGGRWWKATGSGITIKNPADNSTTARKIEGTGEGTLNTVACGTPSKSTGSLSGAPCTQPLYAASLTEVKSADSSLDLCRILPVQVLNNVHQSGVNCLHVSIIQGSRDSFGSLCYVLSGGDDQALHCIGFDMQLLSLSQYSENKDQGVLHSISGSESTNSFMHCIENRNYSIRFLCHDKVPSAHSSAVKGTILNALRCNHYTLVVWIHQSFRKNYDDWRHELWMPFMPEFLFSCLFFIQCEASVLCSSMFGFCKIIAMKIF